MRSPFSRLSLLWKLLLSTSVAITVLLAVTGWLVQRHTTATATASMEEEARSSLRAYEALWHSRAEMLASICQVISATSDVRAAFSTGDQATIQDTAGDIWSRVSRQDALFLVTDPHGRVVASLAGLPEFHIPEDLEVVRAAQSRFPKQSGGFMQQDNRLYHVVITPVYVQATRGSALLDVLVAGYAVDAELALQLKAATSGSEFQFLVGGKPIASSLPAGATASGYVALETDLPDVRGGSLGKLRILRSPQALQQRLARLRQDLLWIWILTVLIGLLLTALLARHIIRPLRTLDAAAAEVARQNYEHRIPVESEDELGRLAGTFNTMCASIQQAREELVRQEQISTIGRLSTSIVHDLRNPLATIYGGAEMLVDQDLPSAQVKRLATNIYRASRRMQELLQDLVNVSRGKSKAVEPCRLRDVAQAAFEPLAAQADAQEVGVEIDVPSDIELPLDRSRMERVFHNLFLNALEAMPNGGSIHVSASRSQGVVMVQVEDTGPGIPEVLRLRLFQPFASEGKKNGLGLGLALARQTVLDHGGDLWAASQPGHGARFCLRLCV